MVELFRKSALRVGNSNNHFVRYLYQEIEWEDRLIGLKGARGTGKTTLMLQYLKNTFGKSQKGLYISLDDLYFTRNELTKLAEDFMLTGGTHLFIDEVHKYPNWSIEIKNLYDTYENLNIVFSGSSALQLQKADADLSRRAAIYELRELSFREYLEFTNIKTISSINLKELLKNHAQISKEITSDFSIIPHFHAYLEKGVYPFFKEAKGQFYLRLQSVITTILENDLPQIENINYQTVYKLKKLLLLIADSVPFKINTAELSRKSGLSRDVVLKMLKVLNRACLINTLHQQGAPTGHLTKPDKVYLHNSVLYYALHSNSQPPVGTARETFFANQLQKNHLVNSSKTADFIVDNTYLFEIGGSTKGKQQLKNEKNSYLGLDNLELGFNNVIPLWMFGMLY
jgi:hypothetical protein